MRHAQPNDMVTNVLMSCVTRRISSGGFRSRKKSSEKSRVSYIAIIGNNYKIMEITKYMEIITKSTLSLLHLSGAERVALPGPEGVHGDHLVASDPRQLH